MSHESEQHPDSLADVVGRLDRIEAALSRIEATTGGTHRFVTHLNAILSAFTMMKGRAGKVLSEVIAEAERNGPTH